MKLRDRIAAWFGYVPAERLADVVLTTERRPCDMSYWRGMSETVTSVTTPPAILVASDFKRGIPCS